MLWPRRCEGAPKIWPYLLLMVGRPVQASCQVSHEACPKCADLVQLACRLLFLLGTGSGTAAVGPPGMLLSMCPPMQPFAQLPLHQREAILQGWTSSPIPLVKKVRRTSPRLRMHAYIHACAQARGEGGGPLYISCKHFAIESGRTSVRYLGQGSHPQPFRHKQRMLCWLADRKQSGALPVTSPCGFICHAQGSAQWEPSQSTGLTTLLPASGGSACSAGTCTCPWTLLSPARINETLQLSIQG